MQREEVMIGLALLVLSLIFFYSVAILIVVDAMITVGVVFLVSGLGIFGAEARKPKTSAKTADLSALDRVVLQMISQNNGQEEIAKSTGVSPAILADKSAALTSAGYLSGNHLTEKGFEALRDLGVDRT